MEQGTIRLCQIIAPGGRALAQIAPDLGGIVSSLVLPGPGGLRECLHQCKWFWDPKTDETRGGIPLLFPVCGRHPKLPIHGFAMRMPWQILEHKTSSMRLGLEDSSRTRAIFPYSFNLQLEYRIAESGLFCGLAVRNTGAVPMPFYAGFHPYFSVPGDKADVLLEAFPKQRHLYSADFTDLTGAAPPPAFPAPLARPSLNQMLLAVGDNPETSLIFPDGFGLKMNASSEFRYRQLYTIPDQPFFCVEPWMAAPGAMARGEHVTLKPGESLSASISISSWSIL